MIWVEIAFAAGDSIALGIRICHWQTRNCHVWTRHHYGITKRRYQPC
jgi:hypothetical protein